MNPPDSPSPPSRESLIQWFGDAADGTISPENLASLESALSASSEVRQLWFLFHDMEIGLSDWAASQSNPPESAILASVQASQATLLTQPSPKQPRFSIHPILRKNQRSSIWTVAIATAAVILLSLTLWLSSQALSPGPIATLTRSHNATWLHGAIATGTTIPSPRMIDLTSGMVEFEMSSGTRIVFEGPGRIELSSPNSVKLPTGRLHATVPPSARGFTVTGNGFVAIDHGTEFGCSAPQHGHPELHVFKGSVEVKPGSSGSRMLQSNQAVAISNQQLEPITPKPDDFITPDSLRNLLSTPATSIDLARNQLKHHPQIHFYLDARIALDASAQNDPASPHATDCHFTTGRSTEIPALCFNGTTSRIDVPTKLTTPVATLIAWVKVADPRRRQDLLSQDGPITRGEVGWYLNHNNALGVGVLNPPKRRIFDGIGWQHAHASNPPFEKHAWQMLATVLDAHTGTATHYLNGKPIHHQKLNMPGFFKFGPLVIGTAPDSHNPNQVNRSFHGLLDEFALLSTALSPEEIQRLYILGSPNASLPP